MKQVITAKLKLITTPEQHHMLRQTQLTYRDALNYVSHYAFDHDKTSNEKRLREGTYYTVRTRFKLPSEMTNNVIRQVGSTYKGLWTRAKQNGEQLRKKFTRKHYKGLDQPPRYVSPTIMYDYGFKPQQQISIRALEKRLIIPYHGYKKHIALIQQGTTIKAARLWYDQRHKQFYLLVSLEIAIVDPTPDTLQTVVGVDIGQRYLATTATLSNQQFFSGKFVRAKADHFTRKQKQLQHKGTRSAIRRLRAMSGRERRFKLNLNHVIAKTIIAGNPNSLIGLENLTSIRERTNRRRYRRRGKRKLLLTSKQRRALSHASKWSFAELQRAISYKAALAGNLAIKVDADYTSQMCPMCGYADTENRPHKGLLFVCKNSNCLYKLHTHRSYTLHADLVGARNIAMRTFLVRQDWMRTGVLSVRPDVSGDEAKTKRLQRYFGLRWSPDTSSYSFNG